jgi:hypothetical protein
MRRMQMHTWENLTPDGTVRALKYSFGMGSANTMAARIDDGSWLVISPATGAPEAALEALAQEGPVSALVANNAFHHLGQPMWRKRFPQAVSYAAAGSLPRLAKKAAGIPFRPIEELKLPPSVRLVQPAGMKVPDLLAAVETPHGAVWFGGDLISNTVAADLKPFARFIFGLLGGGPGYRFNPVPAFVYLKDKAGWKAATRKLLLATPPAVVLPAHGEPVRDDAAARSQAILG